MELESEASLFGKSSFRCILGYTIIRTCLSNDHRRLQFITADVLAAIKMQGFAILPLILSAFSKLTSRPKCDVRADWFFVDYKCGSSQVLVVLLSPPACYYQALTGCLNSILTLKYALCSG